MTKYLRSSVPIYPVITHQGTFLGHASNASEAVGLGLAKTKSHPKTASLIHSGQAWDVAITDFNFPTMPTRAWLVRD